MEFSKEQRIIEAILFSAGREVSSKEIMNVLEISEEDIEKIIQNMKTKYEETGSALDIIKVNSSYQLCTKKELYEYIYPIIDNRTKPTISNAALETLSIIAYNPKITRSEILQEKNTWGYSASKNRPRKYLSHTMKQYPEY